MVLISVWYASMVYKALLYDVVPQGVQHYIAGHVIAR